MHFIMGSIEDGTVAGKGLSVLETVTTFVIIPLGLFAVIALLSWVGSAPRKLKKQSSITSID